MSLSSPEHTIYRLNMFAGLLQNPHRCTPQLAARCGAFLADLAEHLEEHRDRVAEPVDVDVLNEVEDVLSSTYRLNTDDLEPVIIKRLTE